MINMFHIYFNDDHVSTKSKIVPMEYFDGTLPIVQINSEGISKNYVFFNLNQLISSLSHHMQSASEFVTGRNEVVAKVIFLHLSVILFRGEVSASVHAGIPHTHPPPEQTPPRADTPQSRHPPGADIPLEQTSPWSRHPPGADTPLEQTSPWSRHPPGADPHWSRHPPQEADSGIRSMSSRYASYWNAFLFKLWMYFT